MKHIALVMRRWPTIPGSSMLSISAACFVASSVRLPVPTVVGHGEGHRYFGHFHKWFVNYRNCLSCRGAAQWQIFC